MDGPPQSYRVCIKTIIHNLIRSFSHLLSFISLYLEWNQFGNSDLLIVTIPFLIESTTSKGCIGMFCTGSNVLIAFLSGMLDSKEQSTAISWQSCVISSLFSEKIMRSSVRQLVSD